jgi:hypothetical protein
MTDDANTVTLSPCGDTESGTPMDRMLMVDKLDVLGDQDLLDLGNQMLNDLTPYDQIHCRNVVNKLDLHEALTKALDMAEDICGFMEGHRDMILKLIDILAPKADDTAPAAPLVGTPE